MTGRNRPRRPVLEHTLAAFEAFEQRIMAVHAPAFTSIDLTMAQAKLLYVVAAAGELSMSEIALRLGVTISTASGAVDHLVSIELLSRVDDPANRRQVRVSITPLGAQTLEQLRELSARQLRSLFDVLGDDDLEVIDRAIRILAEAVETAASQPARSDP